MEKKYLNKIIDLYLLGEWHVNFEIDKYHDRIGYSTLFNGQWYGDVVYVHPRHEIESYRSSNISMFIQIWSLLALTCVFIIGIIIKSEN